MAMQNNDPAFSLGRPIGMAVTQAIAVYKTAFPDLKCTVQDTITGNDKVVLHWTLSAANLGEFLGNHLPGDMVEASD
jgi:hypothetical protein